MSRKQLLSEVLTMANYNTFQPITCYAGAMTYNTTSILLEYYRENPHIGIISSRRQIDTNSGYVNHWNTKTFHSYVRSRSKIVLERDHGGPSQGDMYDDGLDSFVNDVSFFDIIHIDPWKQEPDLERGIEYTVNYINKLYDLNNNILFEVGTEQAIRPFSVEELEYLLAKLKEKLSPPIFESIIYCVIQSGTQIIGDVNTGAFCPEKTRKMIELCNRYRVLSKDHNGDYIDPLLIKERYSLGLHAINIAPEIAHIESSVILDIIDNNKRQEIFDKCISSHRWEKWFDKDFDPQVNINKLIQCCGHYVSSDIELGDLQSKVIDETRHRLFQFLNNFKKS